MLVLNQPSPPEKTPKSSNNKSSPDSNQKVVDPQLVPDAHRSLFRALKHDGSGSSDEDSKGKKVVKYEPQAIRPNPTNKP